MSSGEWQSCLDRAPAFLHDIFKIRRNIVLLVNLRIEFEFKILFKRSNMSLMNEGVILKNELKKEIGEEQHDSAGNRHAQFNSQASYSSVSSISSLSNFNEPLKMNNQHMNNMISSYSKCGKSLPRVLGYLVSCLKCTLL